MDHARRLLGEAREVRPSGVQLAFGGAQRRTALREDPLDLAHRCGLLRRHPAVASWLVVTIWMVGLPGSTLNAMADWSGAPPASGVTGTDV